MDTLTNAGKLGGCMPPPPTKSAALPERWEYLGEVLRLLWECRWAVMCALGLYAACIWAFVAVLPPVRALPSLGIESVLGYGPPALFATLAFTLPMAVVLHAAGNRAIGQPVACLQSCVTALLRQPRLVVFAAMLGGSFTLMWHLLFRTNGAAHELTGLMTSGFEINSPWPWALFFLLAATYFIIVPLISLLVVLRLGALGPAFVVLDGCGVVSAWKDSFRAMSMRCLFRLGPYLGLLFFAIVWPYTSSFWSRHRWEIEEVVRDTVILSAFVAVFASAALIPLWRHARSTMPKR